MPQSRGTRRERQVRELLEADHWVCLRSAGSLGPVDIAALKRGQAPHFVQVKSDQSSPYKNFGPAARTALRDLAYAAGAEPWLAWWPRGRSLPIWSHGDTWPVR